MTVMVEMDRALRQRMDALASANEIRSARKVLKQDMKAGRAQAVDVLLEPEWWAETMTVHALLMAIPKYGRVKAARKLNQCAVSPSKQIGALTPRQRVAIAGLLPR